MNGLLRLLVMLRLLVTGTSLSCAAGSYCNPFSSSCKNNICTVTCNGCSDCSAGTFSSQNSSSSCTACPPGSFSSTNKATACLNCSAGTYSFNSSSTRCSNCPFGFYNPDQGVSTCQGC